jgi:hypothetical protein
MARGWAAVVIGLAVLASACGDRPAPSAVTRLSSLEVAAALESTIRGGPVAFRATSVIMSQVGDLQTVGVVEGVVDLGASRGRAVQTGLPGTPLAFSEQVELDGDHLYLAVNDGWELRYGGAASFLDLGFAPTSDARTVLVATIPKGATFDVANVTDDAASAPPGFFRLGENDAGEAQVNILIDPVSGRLVGIVETRSTGRTDLRFGAFGVPLDFEPPTSATP